MIQHKNSICKNTGSHKLHVRSMSIMQIVITYFYAHLDRKISDRISLQRHGFAKDIKHEKYVIGRSSKPFVYNILLTKKKKKKKNVLIFWRIMQIVITYFYAHLDRKISDIISLQRHCFASDIKHENYVIGRSSKPFVYKILSTKKCFNFSAQLGVYSLMNSS